MNWMSIDSSLGDTAKVRMMARVLKIDRDAIVAVSGINYADIDDLARQDRFADAMIGARLLDVDEHNSRLTFKLIGGLHRRSYSGLWQRLRSKVFERDRYTCQYCGSKSKKLDCDHKIPVSRGGSNEISNLVTACFTCNRSKRALTAEEFMAVRRA